MKKELQQKIDAPYSKDSVQQSLYGVLLQKRNFHLMANGRLAEAKNAKSSDDLIWTEHKKKPLEYENRRKWPENCGRCNKNHVFFEHKVGRICDNLQANLHCISIKT